MAKQPAQYEAFLEMVDPQHRDFVNELHALITQSGCTAEIKPTRGGYLVSYKLASTKRSVANYVFRKSGLLLRIYGDCVNSYEEQLDAAPGNMLAAIRKATDCKRLTQTGGCNPRCAAGYDFTVQGERYQKCRNSALFFQVNAENKPCLRALLVQELAARRLAAV